MTAFARFRAAGPLLALAAAALAFDADPRLPWVAGVAAAGLFAAAAVLRAVQVEVELRQARRSVTRYARADLQREIDRVLRVASPARLPGSSPLNRVAVRRHADLIRRLGDQPLSAEGLELARKFLRDSSSPLYSDRAEELVPRALARIFLEVE